MQAPNDLLLAADGSTCKVDRWHGGSIVAWDKDANRLTTSYSPPTKQKGAKPVLHITLKTGRALTLTRKHSLLTWQGFTRASNIQLHQRIAVIRKYHDFGSFPVKSPWLIGLLIGDGGLTGSTPKFTNEDPIVIEAATKAIRDRGWEIGLLDTDCINYSIKRNDCSNEDSCTAWLEDLNLLGHKSATKRIPKQVFQASNQAIADCIAGLFDADGHVNAHGGGKLSITSISHGLVQDVQHLFARLGIISKVNIKRGTYKGEDHVAWRVTVRSRDILTFADKITLRSTKQAKLLEVAATQAAKKMVSGKALDRFPTDVYKDLTHSASWFRGKGISVYNRDAEPTRYRMESMAPYEPLIKARLNEPLLWDEVVAIEPLKPTQVYSIESPEHQTYITGNDVVTGIMP